MMLSTVRSCIRPPSQQRLLAAVLSQCVDQNCAIALTMDESRERRFGAALLSSGFQTRCFSSDDQHEMFKKQMEELRQEREGLFGHEDPMAEANATAAAMAQQQQQQPNDNQPATKADIPSRDSTIPSDKEMENLKAERDALYGFTDSDRTGWSNWDQNHQHSSSFMQEVQAARQQQEQQQQAQEKNNDQGNDMGATDQGEEERLTHITEDGTSVHMVNVAKKKVTDRIAVAESRVVFPDHVWQALTSPSSSQRDSSIQDGGHTNNPMELVGPKGPILTTAKIAGIMAAKKTSDLIPLCHPLPLNSVNVEIALDANLRTAFVQCECHVTHKTGVEMEALTGATVAALTLYDMTKALSHDIEIQQTCLIRKSGGKRNVNREQ